MAKTSEGYRIILYGAGLERLRRHIGGNNLFAIKDNLGAPGDSEPGKKNDRTQGYSEGSLWINERLGAFLCVRAIPGAAVWMIVGFGFTEDSAVSNDERKKALIGMGNYINTVGKDLTITIEGEVIEKEVIEDQGEEPAKEDEPGKENSESEGKSEKTQEKGPESETKQGASGTDGAVDGTKPTSDETKKDRKKNNNVATYSFDTGETERGDPVLLDKDLKYFSYLEKNKVLGVTQLQVHINNNTLKKLKYFNEARAKEVEEALPEWLASKKKGKR